MAKNSSLMATRLSTQNPAIQEEKTRLHSHPRPNGRNMVKYIYSFDEGNKEMKTLFGGKGACLAEMSNIGLPVPPGFIITTETCELFLKDFNYPDGFWKQFEEKLMQLEKKTGKKFGDPANPLLVSVRSGAAISMPGMMDTILNLGLNDETLHGLLKRTKNERFCYDTYRRFVNMFGNVVMGVAHEKFEEVMDKIKKTRRVKLDTELSANDLKKLVYEYKKVIEKNTKKKFPENPKDQLRQAIEAVFSSWNNERAKTYRKIHKITGLRGTAVNIQTMVFGNMGETSGTGVAFTRNPSTGGKEFYGEFLMNAQGEDVVAGIRTPQKITQLKEVMPKAYSQLLDFKERLEKHYKDMQDIEFTIEDRKLYILQTRNGKRTGQAAIKIAVDMVREGLLKEQEALLKVDPELLKQLLHPTLDPNAKKTCIARGLPASPGAASGKVVFTAEDAVLWAENGEKVILVRKETCPEDIHGMYSAQGILTSMGGLTSHAALVCRGMGKSCVAGSGDIHVDYKRKVFMAGGASSQIMIKEGDIITIDGTRGEVYLGALPTRPPEISSDFQIFMRWVDKIRKLKVRTNADTPKDARQAREFGAEGIGLCRTEHMFFQEDRIPKMREMILAKDETGRRKALQKLLPLQRSDFREIFKVMDGYPVTIRLLDPPLHEFLPENPQKVEVLAKQMKISVHELQDLIDHLHEINPMLGHRGCRLGITYPEINEMQVRAILEAAIEVSKNGVKVFPEIEVPLVGILSELEFVTNQIKKIIKEYSKDISFPIKIGTMIELPRACLVADEIARMADFFSFGTNDLTQTTFGFSRDDAGKFLSKYMELGILETDPTETIDRKGVGELMKICVRLGRSEKPALEIGICGEHGGDPKSVEFCHEINLNYVSCSPFRISIAKLAAARAQIKNPRG